VTAALDARGPIDPEGFDADLEPAVVHLASGAEVLVAHHEPEAGGWLSLVGWRGSRVRLPPGRVAVVETVETATGGGLNARQRIVGDDLRAEVESAIENGAPELSDGLAAMQCGGGQL
jgi:hypothetical protein